MEEIFNQLTNVFNKQKETIMSLSDFIKQQGRKEGIDEGVERGRKEGIFTIAKNMLQKKTDINFIREVTGLPMASIRRLQVA
jgi:predicted transposase/invertase (TIGR01784 family)